MRQRPPDAMYKKCSCSVWQVDLFVSIRMWCRFACIEWTTWSNEVDDWAAIHLFRTYHLLLSGLIVLVLFLMQTPFVSLIPGIMQPHGLDAVVWVYQFRVLTVTFIMLPFLVGSVVMWLCTPAWVVHSASSSPLTRLAVWYQARNREGVPFYHTAAWRENVAPFSCAHVSGRTPHFAAHEPLRTALGLSVVRDTVQLTNQLYHPDESVLPSNGSPAHPRARQPCFDHQSPRNALSVPHLGRMQNDTTACGVTTPTDDEKARQAGPVWSLETPNMQTMVQVTLDKLAKRGTYMRCGAFVFNMGPVPLCKLGLGHAALPATPVDTLHNTSGHYGIVDPIGNEAPVFVTLCSRAYPVGLLLPMPATQTHTVCYAVGVLVRAFPAPHSHVDVLVLVELVCEARAHPTPNVVKHQNHHQDHQDHRVTVHTTNNHICQQTDLRYNNHKILFPATHRLCVTQRTDQPTHTSLEAGGSRSWHVIPVSIRNLLGVRATRGVMYVYEALSRFNAPDREEMEKLLCHLLYPDDSTELRHLLVRQDHFKNQFGSEVYLSMSETTDVLQDTALQMAAF